MTEKIRQPRIEKSLLSGRRSFLTTLSTGSASLLWGCGGSETAIQPNVESAQPKKPASGLQNSGLKVPPQLPTLGAFLQQAVIYEGWRNGGVFDPYTALSANGVQVARTVATTLSCPDLDRLPVKRWRELGWKEDFWACREMAAATLTKSAEAGMRLQLALFFSDKAADAGGGRQKRPAAWSGLSNSQLVEQVRNYARETAAYFKGRGLNLDVVEIGNETDFGFCGYRLGETISVPAGVDPVNDPQWMHDNVWSLCSPLYQAAIEGIKSVFPDCATALHIAGFTYSRQDIVAHSFFSAMKSDGVTYDIAGLSYPYPSTGARLIPQPYFEQESFLGALDKIRALGKRVQILEFSYPASTAGIEVSQAVFGCTPAAQARFVEAIARAVAGRVEQISYWAADVFPGINGVGGLPKDVESFGLFASALEARQALNSWRRVAADRLMNWAEIKYADLFPGSAQSATEGPYYYRYYPASDTYLGIDERSGSVLVHNGRSFNMAVIGPLATVLRMM